MTRDARGDHLSGATAEAVTAYDRAVRALLAMHGFRLEEAGIYPRAEHESRAAAELEPLSF